MAGGATQHRITTQGSTQTPCSTRHATLLQWHRTLQDGVPTPRPLAPTKPVRQNPKPGERVEARGLPCHSGCSWWLL